MTTMISGFTFIKNGLTLGYPIAESIKSIEPLCDEIVINVGFEDTDLTIDDGTYTYLRDTFPEQKFKFLKSYWDPQKRKQGLILSEQTNIALANCQGKYAQYIQGDECIHEDDLKFIEDGIRELDQSNNLNALIFNYYHFYGNVDVYKYTRNMYRREVRLIKNHIGMTSWLDAQGFRCANHTKPQGILIPARIFHYGWARKEMIMKKKVQTMDKLYHEDISGRKEFNYERNWGTRPFLGNHPSVMKEWIENHQNPINIMELPLTIDWKNIFGLVLSDFIEKLTSYRLGEFKNYQLAKKIGGKPYFYPH